MMKPSNISIAVSYGVPETGVPDEGDFLRWVAAAVGRRLSNAEVSLRVVDATEGHELNMRYRHRDYETNVLSFRADLPPEIDHPLLGDIVLCAPVISTEAIKQGKPPMEHWAHMTIHGTLHLMGLNHETPAEARDMEALETQVLESLGISDPYIER